MDKKYTSLEQTIRSMQESIGTVGSDKYQGNQFKSVRTVTPHIGPDKHTQSAENVSNARKMAKEKTALNRVNKESVSDMSGITAATQTAYSENGKNKKIKETVTPNHGNAASVAQWPAAESGKKKIKEEADVPSGTEERRKVDVVGRPWTANNAFDVKSKLYKLAQIKTKIIDEEKKQPKEKIKLEKGKTQIDLKPTIKPPPIQEGLADNAKKLGKVASIVAPLASAHAGKAVDAGLIAQKKDPVYAAATVASYVNPKSAVFNSLPTAFSPSQANKGEDEKARQEKFKNTKKETKKMSEELNPLVAAFLKLQETKAGNMFEAAKKLSDKQKNMAKLAGDKSKIDSADLAALRSGKKMEEEVEEIDEVSKQTLGSYVKKATDSVHRNVYASARHAGEMIGSGQANIKKPVNPSTAPMHVKDAARKTANRKVGIGRAVDRLTKEDVEEVNEISNKTLGSYVKKANKQIDKDEKVLFDPQNPIYRSAEKGNSKAEEKYSATSNRYNKRLSGISKATSKMKEEVEFSEAELEHINSVLEALGMSKDATQKGSFKKGGSTPNGDQVGDTVPTRNLTDSKHCKEEKEEKKDRDPRTHIQVMAGRAAAGSNIDFEHDDGSKTTITPQMGRKIVSHLNSKKPAERQDAVKKMHASSKGMI